MSNITQTSSVHKSIYLTKRGNFIPKVEEIYLRKDIPCGYKNCILCLKKLDFFNFEDENITPESQIIEENEEKNLKNVILILDIAGLINSLDCLLSSDLFFNQVIPHSIISWLQKNSKTGFKKLKTFLELDNHGQMRVFPDKFCADLANIKIEFPHDHLLNKISMDSIASCSKMAGYFVSHLSFLGDVQVVILSDNDRLRVFEQVKSHSPSLSRVSICNLTEYLQNFVKDEVNINSILDSVPPSLSDMKQQLSAFPKFINNQKQVEEFFKSSLENSEKEGEDNNTHFIKETKALEDLNMRVNQGVLFRGKLRISRNNPKEGVVGCRVLNRDVQISGVEDLNYALHGDFVAVEVYPVSKWIPLNQAELRLEDESNEAYSKPESSDQMKNQGI
jgi:hypothetical protein